MRKLLIAVAACGVLAMGASQPAEARVFFGFGYGHPGFNHRPFGPRCYFKNVKVKVWSQQKHRYVWVWRTKRFCW